jgi:hypothetical protein
MVSVDGHDLEKGRGTGGGTDKRDGVPGADDEEAEQGEVETWKFEGKEFGGKAGAEDWALGPGGGKALGMVRVQVGQEVSLAVACPPVHRYQALLHLPKAVVLTERSEQRMGERDSVSVSVALGGEITSFLKFWFWSVWKFIGSGGMEMDYSMEFYDVVY